MYKHLIKSALGLMGLMGTLAIGVVNAQETCGSGYVGNLDGTGCELIQVTFDANGGNFLGGETTKTVDTTVVVLPPVRYSHTSNINDDGVATSVYADNLSKNDVVTIPGATSLDIEVRFSTESASYDWLAIYPAGITPTSSNYSSATISNGKLAGHGSYTGYTKPNDSDTTYHRNFTVTGDTAQFYFKSSPVTAYYGYYAIINGIGGDTGYKCEYNIQDPIKEGYIFLGWYTDTEFTQAFDATECLSSNTTMYAKRYQLQQKDIVLEATSTATYETLKINKYFANAYVVNRGDGSPVENLTGDTIHTYKGAGTYTIILSLTGGATRWTFQNQNKQLIPKNGTTMTGVKITYMPSLADGFGANATVPGNYFFRHFNRQGAITSLPENSFDTSNITTAGNDFFRSFNNESLLIKFPEGSFNISNIGKVGNNFFSHFNRYGLVKELPEQSFRLATGLITVGNDFFSNFNYQGALTSLPDNSFNMENITKVGNDFFSNFNYRGALTSLPDNSFNTENITTVGNSFFYYFNYGGILTRLPDNSFRLSTGLTTVGNSFFSYFNYRGALTSLPDNSFNTENITKVGNGFFVRFNTEGALTSLPENSFDTKNITKVGYSFFNCFNYSGALTSLPDNSFRFSTGLTTVGDSFFYYFNNQGALTSLPDNSFNTENITTVGDEFFVLFNDNGALTSLPDNSFRFSTGLTTVGNGFFARFNNQGALTRLPAGSFNTENITTVDDYFFVNFNNNGALTSLPDNSFRLSTGLTTAGNSFFAKFNYQGAITSLPEGSFDTSKITTVGSYFFDSFNNNGQITSLPDSFKLTSAAYNKTDGYNYAFNSPNYTFNRKVSDIVSGVTAPSNDRDIFSDNQPGRCGVHANWLVSIANACSITYDSNGGSTITSPNKKYNANTTRVSVGDGIIAPPNRVGYTLGGWQNASGENIDEVLFPAMDGETLYARWTINEYTITFVDGSGTETDVIYTGAYESVVETQYPEWTKEGYTIHWDKEIPSTMPLNGNTITASWISNEYTIIFVDGSGRETDVIYTGAYESIVETQYPEWTKEGYTIHWDKEIPSTMPLSGDTITASWIINEYTLTLDVDGTLTVITGEYGSPIMKPSDPTKNGYRFIGWGPEIPTTMPAEDMTIKAKWEKLGSSGGGGGGGGGGGSTKPDTSKEEQKPEETPQNSTSSGTNEKEPKKETTIDSQLDGTEQVSADTSTSEGQEILSPSDSPRLAGQASFTKEQKEAYEFAKGKGITTMPTIQQAKIDGKLTRIAMAKMLSYYAINVLGQKPDETRNIKFKDVTDKMDKDYDDGVTLAYQLGIMGINMPNNKFRPNDEVPRAEFATALSRMIYNTSDGEYRSTPKYYIHHMEKLVEEGIITNDDPNMKELRGYVMIMLKRSTK